MIGTAEARVARRGGLGGRIEGAWTGGGRFADLGLRPAEALYRLGIALRNRAFDVRLLRAHRAGVPVVSVGNLLVGGAGKTPFTRWLVAELLARGEQPGILHGGYAADEPDLHRRWYPELPVVVGRDRVRSAAAAIEQGATVLVLDDAFQHRRIERDLDIVLVPAEGWTARPRLLPRGPWREPVTSLARAELIVVTRRTASAALAADVGRSVAAILATAPRPPKSAARDAAPGAAAAARAAAAVDAGQAADAHAARDLADAIPIARAWLRADAWRTVGTAGAPDLSARPDAPVVAVAAIARPAAFLENARDAGASIGAELLFADHHGYNASDVARIREVAAGRPIVTTEKDWVKLGAVGGDLYGWVLEQAVELEGGTEHVAAALDALPLGAEPRHGTGSA